jgi:hypothetical protein
MLGVLDDYLSDPASIRLRWRLPAGLAQSPEISVAVCSGTKPALPPARSFDQHSRNH